MAGGALLPFSYFGQNLIVDSNSVSLGLEMGNDYKYNRLYSHALCIIIIVK